MSEIVEIIKEPLVQIIIVINLVLLFIIFSQKKYFALVFARFRNKNNGHEVRIWHKDQTFTDYLVPNVRTFDWKQKRFSKVFDNLPDWVNQVRIPNTPHARDRRTNFAYYEFNEDSKDSIDPYDRQPDLSTFEADAADLTNAFDLGRKFEKLKAGSGFNKLLMIFMVMNFLVGAAAVIILSQQGEAFQKFGQEIKPLIDRGNQLIADFDSGKIRIPGLNQPAPTNQAGQLNGSGG